MAVLLVESFDWITAGITGAQLDGVLSRKCPARNVTEQTDGDTDVGMGGKGTAARLAEAGLQFIRWYLSPVPSASDEVGMGIWYKATGSSGVWGVSGSTLFGLRDAGGSTYHLNIFITADGFIRIRAGSTILETTPVSISKNEWNWFDFKTVVNATTGSYTVRLNGTIIASDSSVNTDGGGVGSASFAQVAGVVNFNDRNWYGGVIAWDDNAGSLTDFPTLPISFVSIHPDADGDDEQWTLSSGTDSYALVNEQAPMDDDSNYLEDSTTGNRSLFTYDNISANFTGVHGLQINAVLRETDASDFTFINTFKQNSTLYPEAAQAVAGQTYESLFNVLDQDPDTATAWTVSGINSLQAGIEVG